MTAVPDNRDDRSNATAFSDAECDVVWAPGDALVVHRQKPKSPREAYGTPAVRNARPDITSQHLEMYGRPANPRPGETGRDAHGLTLDELAERIAESFGVPMALIRRESEGLHGVYAMQDPDTGEWVTIVTIDPCRDSVATALIGCA